MKSKSDFNAIKKALNNLKTKVNNNIVKLSFESNTGLIVSRELSCCRTVKTHNEDKEFKDFLKDTIDNGSFKTSGYIEVIKESDKEYFLKLLSSSKKPKKSNKTKTEVTHVLLAYDNSIVIHFKEIQYKNTTIKKEVLDKKLTLLNKKLDGIVALEEAVKAIEASILEN